MLRTRLGRSDAMPAQLAPHAILIVLHFSGSRRHCKTCRKQHFGDMTAQHQLNREAALEFLESAEVQATLADMFAPYVAREDRPTIRSNFWKHAGEGPKMFKGPTKEALFLYDLFASLQGKHPSCIKSVGAFVDRDSERKVAAIRRHILDKFQKSLVLRRLCIEIGTHDKQHPSYMLVVYRSPQAAEAARKQRGRPSKDRDNYPEDPVSRKVFNLWETIPQVVPRKVIDTVFGQFLMSKEKRVLLLCGSCHSGKTAWMLARQGDHAAHCVYYPFDRASKDITSHEILSRHLAFELATQCLYSSPKRIAGKVATLDDLWGVLSLLRGKLKHIQPTILLDALDEAGLLTDAVLNFIQQCVQQAPDLFRFVLTIRTPTHLLSRLRCLPKTQVSNVFDSRGAVLEFLESWCKTSRSNRGARTEAIASVYEKAGSNLRLATELMEKRFGGQDE